MAYISNPVQPDRARGLRRWLFPLTVLTLCGGAVAFPWVWRATGQDSDSLVMLFAMMMWLAPVLAIVLLVPWWLFFSGVNWALRLGLLAVVLVGIPALYFVLVREAEYETSDLGMVMRFQFVWEPTRQQKFDEFQKQHNTSIDLPAIEATVGEKDFARYRGPNSDGVVSHLKLETDWVKHKPTLLWERRLAGGYSGVAVAGNIAVTLDLRDGREVVVCYDRDTGAERWASGYDAYHRDKFGDGPRSTPTIHDGLILTFGALGDLVCHDVLGEKKWSVNLLKESKATNIQWGMTGSPLIVGDLVIAHAGVDPEANAGMALTAYKYKTGEKVWAVGNRKAGYSSPMLATLDNVEQILMFDGEALAGYDPKTGKEYWQIPWMSKMELNMIQPVVVGKDRVFISSEESNGCALFQIIAPNKEAMNWRVISQWQTKSIGSRFANPVSDGKRLFGLHNITGVLRCIDLENGKILWKGDRYGPGQMLLVDKLLLVVSDKGVVSLLKTDSDAAEVLTSFETFGDKLKTWNTPALAGDQLFLRNQEQIACWKLPGK